MEKIQKWLMVMEADFLETMQRNWLKLLEHGVITLVQFPIKRFVKWMHGFQVMAKTNFVLCLFASRLFANFCMVTKNELGLCCRYGDDGGGVGRLHEDF